MRAGAGWDAICVLALVAPAAGLAAPLAGRAGRAAVVRAGRWGSLLAAVLWTALAAGRVRPTLGAFDPDLATVAAMAGTALVAAVLAVDPAPGARLGPVAALAPPAATITALGIGLVEGPTDLSSASTATTAVVAAGVASLGLALLAARRSRGPAALAAVLLPAVLLVVLRAGRPLLVDGPEGLAAAAGPGAALLGASAALAGRRWAVLAAAAGPVLVTAAALAPLAAARPAAGVLAAGAVLQLAGAGRWATAALAPGLAVLLAAAADLPSPDAEALTHGAWALGVAGTAVGLAWVSWPAVSAAADGHRPAPEARGAVALLAAWLVVVPGHWAWADPPADRLRAWERGAAVGAAALLAAAAVVVALRLAPWADRDADPHPG